MKPADKLKSLIPNGIPRYIRCYDNEGATFDRYTIVFTKRQLNHTMKSRREWMYLTASMLPFHPQGVGLHGFSNELIDRPSYAHLGKRKKFEDMPTDVKAFILQEYFDHWDLEPIYAKLFAHDVNCQYGAPMGRGSHPNPDGKYDFKVHIPLSEGYDAGGAYWGCGSPLYVKTTADTEHFKFERDEK